MKSLRSWSVGIIGLVLPLVQVVLGDFYFVQPSAAHAFMRNLPRLSDNPAVATSNEQELQKNVAATTEAYQSRKPLQPCVYSRDDLTGWAPCPPS
jgi:hypothetical protein